VHSDYSPDPSSALSSSPGQSGRQGQQSTINSPALSPKSQAMSTGAQSHAMSHVTDATPRTFLSGDLSVKTSDSLSHYLRGMEDEISGDVGQEVELVAHAPMALAHSEGSGRSRSDGRVDRISAGGGGGGGRVDHHNYRHIAQQQQRGKFLDVETFCII